MRKRERRELILDEILNAYECLTTEEFAALAINVAYAIKYEGKTLRTFKSMTHPDAVAFYEDKIEPLILDSPKVKNVTTQEWSFILENLESVQLFTENDITVLKDFLTLWEESKQKGFKELVYTKKMLESRTGVSVGEFYELRKFLKAEGCLSWENKPYMDAAVAFYTIYEDKLLGLIEKESHKFPKVSSVYDSKASVPVQG